MLFILAKESKLKLNEARGIRKLPRPYHDDGQLVTTKCTVRPLATKGEVYNGRGDGRSRQQTDR